MVDGGLRKLIISNDISVVVSESLSGKTFVKMMFCCETVMLVLGSIPYEIKKKFTDKTFNVVLGLPGMREIITVAPELSLK